MPNIGRVGRQLTSLIWKASVEEEVDAELAFHVEMRTRELVAHGMDPDAARRAAVARFGDLSRVSRACKTIGQQRERDMRRTEYLSELRQDIRFAIRQLAKSPGFTIVAVLTLALGIGATTAIFSAVQAVILRPFAYAHPDRVMFVFERWRDRDGNVSAGNYVDWRDQAKSFEQLAANSFTSFNLSEGETPERVSGSFVTWNFFPVFGKPPLLGRTFLPDEDQPGREQVTVLSHDLWQRRFAGDRGIIGRQIRVNGRPFTVVGVMPRDFDPFTGQEQLWAPIAFTPDRKQMHDEHYLNATGLLRPGVTLEQAQREMEQIARTEAERFPEDNQGRGARVVSVPEFIIGSYRQRLFILLGAVGFVLLIGCGNVANLLLARASARQKEIAIRTAIGAGRGRIVRQLLTESVVLSSLGAVVGLALAWGGVRLLLAASPPGVPRLEETRIDGIVLLFALGVAVLSALLFGLAPAIRSARGDLQPVLKEGGRGSAIGARDRVRMGLVAGEVALALTLLVGAGLLIRSAIHLERVNSGFDLNVLTARVALPPQAYRAGADETVRSFERMVEHVRQRPGVTGAALTSQAPMGPGGNSNGLLPEGKTPQPDNFINARLRMITPGYLSTMRISLRRGRDFTAQDERSAPLVMIVSEALASAAWPNQDPIGKRIACCEGSPTDPKWKTVVGVAGDVRSGGPMQDPTPEFYLPIRQVPPEAWDWVQRAMTLVARPDRGDPTALTPVLREAVRDVDPTLPLYNVATMSERLRSTMAPARFNTMLLVMLGAVGLVLAAIGIYSVIAYFVTLRTQEIGIRMALGANTRDVLSLLTWQGLRPVLVGVVLGAAAAFWAAGLLQGSLYGVTASDPLTFVAVALLLVTVSLIATLIPARRATKIDPVAALSA